MVDPAVKGTTTVIQSAIKSKASVKRIVLTSSVAGALSSSLLCMAPPLPTP